MRQFIYTVVQQAVREVLTKEVNVRIDSLETHINSVEERLTRRMDDMEKRFEVRFDNIEKTLAGVQGNLEGEARLFHLADYIKKAAQTS